MTVCRGFQWVGQDFSHCERCSRDIREHDGLDWIDRDAPLFSDSILIPFDEARRRIPMFAHYVTPINHPEGPYRYEGGTVSNADAGGAAHDAAIVTQDNTGGTESDPLRAALQDAIEGLNLVIATGQTAQADKYLERAEAALGSNPGISGQSDQTLSEAPGGASQALNFSRTLGPLTLDVEAPEGTDGQVEIKLSGHIDPIHIHTTRVEARDVFRTLAEQL